jgi:hypothetical protein
VDIPRELGAAGGDAIVADALVDPAFGLQRPGEIGAENAAQRHQHEARPQRPFEAGVRQREIRMRDEGGDQQIAENKIEKRCGTTCEEYRALEKALRSSRSQY